MRLEPFLLLALTLVCSPQDSVATEPPISTRPCTDSVFRFQDQFWVNLHLFLRAESRRRSGNAPLQLSVASLGSDEQATWKSALDAYDRMAKLSLITDDGLVHLTNTLAEEGDITVLATAGIEPQIVHALNEAAPIYRAQLWAEHRQENDEWIVAHCSDIQRFDKSVKTSIAKALRAAPTKEAILVDVARETGPTLAYTTNGPMGTAGHTVIAPQKNTDLELSLNTIFHEISHTMDSEIRVAIDKEAGRLRVKAPEDLWHAVTLYTTCEITKRAIARDRRPTAELDTERAKTFEQNGWHNLLVALERDWQPYLDKKVPFGVALADLVRDTTH